MCGPDFLVSLCLMVIFLFFCCEVVYPQNMTPGGIDFHLTEEQWNRYNAILQVSGDVDCVYLHCFSSSDIELNYMVI